MNSVMETELTARSNTNDDDDDENEIAYFTMC